MKQTFAQEKLNLLTECLDKDETIESIIGIIYNHYNILNSELTELGVKIKTSKGKIFEMIYKLPNKITDNKELVEIYKRFIAIFETEYGTIKKLYIEPLDKELKIELNKLNEFNLIDITNSLSN